MWFEEMSFVRAPGWISVLWMRHTLHATFKAMLYHILLSALGNRWSNWLDNGNTDFQTAIHCISYRKQSVAVSVDGADGFVCHHGSVSLTVMRINVKENTLAQSIWATFFSDIHGFFFSLYEYLRSSHENNFLIAETIASNLSICGARFWRRFKAWGEIRHLRHWGENKSKSLRDKRLCAFTLKWLSA